MFLKMFLFFFYGKQSLPWLHVHHRDPQSSQSALSYLSPLPSYPASSYLNFPPTQMGFALTQPNLHQFLFFCHPSSPQSPTQPLARLSITFQIHTFSLHHYFICINMKLSTLCIDPVCAYTIMPVILIYPSSMYLPVYLELFIPVTLSNLSFIWQHKIQLPAQVAIGSMCPTCSPSLYERQFCSK